MKEAGIRGVPTTTLRRAEENQWPGDTGISTSWVQLCETPCSSNQVRETLSWERREVEDNTCDPWRALLGPDRDARPMPVISPVGSRCTPRLSKKRGWNLERAVAERDCGDVSRQGGAAFLQSEVVTCQRNEEREMEKIWNIYLCLNEREELTMNFYEREEIVLLK
jgi:hypothetical protein